MGGKDVAERPHTDFVGPLFRTLFITFGIFLGWALVAQAEDPLQKTSEEFFPLALDGTITLDHSDGAIHIYGWYEPRVRLLAVRKAYTAERLEQIRVETKSAPDSLGLRTVIPAASGLFADRSGTIDYTLSVPEPARLKLKLSNGEISLEGLRGAKVDLELRNGRVFVRNCFAQVRARARDGALEALFEWWENLPATFDYALERGRIRVRLPLATPFRVEARTGQGPIHHQFPIPPAQAAGSGEILEAATTKDPLLSLGLRIRRGNIRLEAIR